MGRGRDHERQRHERRHGHRAAGRRAARRCRSGVPMTGGPGSGRGETSMKKIIQCVLILGACLLAGFSANLHAEDIDIYMDNSTNGDLPNVLFVIDNSSNLASTWGGGGCTGYADKSGAPSLGTNTAGGV